MIDIKSPHFDIWAAGFFDGEGCVLVARCKNSGVRGGWNYYLQVSIAQQDRRPLELINNKFGGSIRLNKGKATYEKKKDHVYTWGLVLSGTNAFAFLKAIQPYCVVKCEQVTEALRWPINDGKQYRGSWNAMPEEERALRAEIRDNLVALRESVKVYANGS
jgi:hypothetical protein